MATAAESCETHEESIACLYRNDIDPQKVFHHQGAFSNISGHQHHPDMAAASGPGEPYQLLDYVRAMPLRAINTSCRRLLARSLDPESTGLTETGVCQDFQGLGELMGYDYADLQDFSAKGKTMALLDAWQKKGQNATIGQLWDFLIEMERFDIVRDEVIRNRIEKDVESFKKREKELSADDYGSEPAIKMHPIPKGNSFQGGMDKYAFMESKADEYKDITVGEVETGSPEMFDAFVSYSIEDIHFVKEMIRMLEQVHGLKLCINARDLVIGTAKYSVTAKLIAERCRKVLIVMSNNFLKEPECDFQVKFAQALSPGSRSKKMIPILIERCDLPLILRHVTLVDNTKCDLAEWFWVRLARSLKAMSYSDSSFEFEEEDDQEGMSVLDYEFVDKEIPSLSEDSDSETPIKTSLSSQPTQQLPIRKTQQTARFDNYSSFPAGSSSESADSLIDILSLSKNSPLSKTKLGDHRRSPVTTISQQRVRSESPIGGLNLPPLPPPPQPNRSQPKKKGFFFAKLKK